MVTGCRTCLLGMGGGRGQGWLCIVAMRGQAVFMQTRWRGVEAGRVRCELLPWGASRGGVIAVGCGS